MDHRAFLAPGHKFSFQCNESTRGSRESPVLFLQNWGKYNLQSPLRRYPLLIGSRAPIFFPLIPTISAPQVLNPSLFLLVQAILYHSVLYLSGIDLS